MVLPNDVVSRNAPWALLSMVASSFSVIRSSMRLVRGFNLESITLNSRSREHDSPPISLSRERKDGGLDVR